MQNKIQVTSERMIITMKDLLPKDMLLSTAKKNYNNKY